MSKKTDNTPHMLAVVEATLKQSQHVHEAHQYSDLFHTYHAVEARLHGGFAIDFHIDNAHPDVMRVEWLNMPALEADGNNTYRDKGDIDISGMTDADMARLATQEVAEFMNEPYVRQVIQKCGA